MKAPSTQLPLSSEQQEWLSTQMAVQTARHEFVNPCVRAHGIGPEGVTCKNCTHLYRKRYSRTYIKCDLRRDTNGPGTDHKAGWPACAKYQERAKE